MDRLYKLIEQLSQKIDKLDDRLDQIDKILVKQEVNIDSHIQRTRIAEENIQLIRDELKPVKKHVAMVNNTMKVLGVLFSGLVVIAGAIASVVKVLEYLS